jgi:hypothetical protein
MARTPSPADNRPPWLEEADTVADAPAHTLVGRRLLWLIIGALLLVGIGIAVGVALIAKRAETPIEVQAMGGEVPVIASPGPWKERPADPGGRPIEGQGQVIYNAGDGGDPGGTIDMNAMPEEPMPRPEAGPAAPEMAREAGNVPVAPAAVARPAPVAAARPVPVAARTSPKPEAIIRPEPLPEKPPAVKAPPEKPAANPAPKPVAAPAAESLAAGGSTIQLGAFSSEAKAKAAWKGFSGRFRYLAGLTPVVLPVARDGTTLYRLRATGAADGADLCRRLKVAGEVCSVVG